MSGRLRAVIYGAGRVPDFEIAADGAVIGGYAAGNAQRVTGTAAMDLYMVDKGESVRRNRALWHLWHNPWFRV